MIALSVGSGRKEGEALHRSTMFWLIQFAVLLKPVTQDSPALDSKEAKLS
jgi:hypothetical protein